MANRYAIVAVLLTAHIHFILSDKVVVQSIKTVNRFGHQHLDYYFICTACGQSLQWRINDMEAGSHFISDPIGQTRHGTGDTGVRYLSTLLTKKQLNSGVEMCLTAVLLVSGISSETMTVFCRGDTERKYTYVSNVSSIVRSKINNGIHLEYAVRSDGILSFPIYMDTIHIFICKVSEASSQSWSINKQPAGRFTSLESRGTFVVQHHAENENVVHREAILLASIPNQQSFISMLILLDDHRLTTENKFISCESPHNREATIKIIGKNSSTTGAVTTHKTTTTTNQEHSSDEVIFSDSTELNTFIDDELKAFFISIGVILLILILLVVAVGSTYSVFHQIFKSKYYKIRENKSFQS